MLLRRLRKTGTKRCATSRPRPCREFKGTSDRAPGGAEHMGSKTALRSRGQAAGIKRTPLVPRVKVWLETEGHYALGFGLSQILEAVQKAGSIKQGAAALGKSYRY